MRVSHHARDGRNRGGAIVIALPTSLLARAAQHPINVSGTCANARTRREYLDQALVVARPEYTDRKSLLDDAMCAVENYLKEKTMTTTQQTAAPAAPRSAAHQEMIELREEVAYLRDLAIRNHAQIMETLNHLAENRGHDNIRRDEMQHSIDQIITMLEQAPATRQPAPLTGHAPAAQPATTAANASGAIEILQGVAIKKGVNEANGEMTIKITTTDSRFSKFGVTVWPEVQKAIGIDAATLAFGATPFEKKIKVTVNNGKSKVIGLA